ncbi:CopL family metal-binding regulatory protein [Lysobacter enzymogenes]|uniref:CopL family metal-binding regulatory protein n=1 Tax=Lysobacter enzymogenes TaxID=69 RepID=UPI00099E1356|nr:CopL family metal-binding regulatory protein [Lysobacter enzymogenes]UZW63235.1 CopL family metal-binding regulatory protein [Lysobacter enzymogenes]
MSFLSLLLRLSLIVALSLNGYASAAMIASGGHAMGPHTAMTAAPAADPAMADCHEGMDLPAMAHADGPMQHHGAAPGSMPDSTPHPGDPAAPHEGDCCGKFACQCDCLQAASIAHAIVPLPPRLDEIAPALPNAHAPPSGVLSLPIRPPIA